MILKYWLLTSDVIDLSSHPVKALRDDVFTWPLHGVTKCQNDPWTDEIQWIFISANQREFANSAEPEA